ncbi:MAG: hypothetical protein V1703_01885 [Candidatus Altiarchaeota archaeon]
MKGLLTVLLLVVNMFNGTPGVDKATTTTMVTTTTIPESPHQIVCNLEKCNSVSGQDKKNLCYAQASDDPFFCDRIQEQELKDECYKKI